MFEPRVMTSATIRHARPADAGEIAAIYRDAVIEGVASFELEPPSEIEILDRYRTIVAAGFPYVVADQDGQVLGYAYVSSYRTRPAYRFTVENSVYVAKTAQGRGIGPMLLEALIEMSTASGYRQMIAVIGGGSLASIKLHERHGFSHAGTLRAIGHKHGRWLETVLMQRGLGEGHDSPPRGLSIMPESPDQPAVHAFLAASDAYAHSLYPPESNHLLDIRELMTPSVNFYVARRDGPAVGCGAFVTADEREPDAVEIKRMWVSPDARGDRIGARILERLECMARASGARVARLETGIHNREALALYRRAGYAEIGPFGSYQPDPLSVFMTKGL